MLRRLTILALAALTLPAAAEVVVNVVPEATDRATFRSEYSVSIYGLTIGRSRFESSFRGDSFRVQGTLASAGLARVFDSTNGETSVQGRFSSDGATRPSAFMLAYKSGRKSQRVSMNFSGGRVTRTDVTPTPKKRGSTWIPVKADHLRAVADPISATMVKVASPENVCRRTIHLYDGEIRADLELSSEGSRPVSTGGYQGDAVICRARFVPISGYRSDHKSTAYLRDRSVIEIAFAPLGPTGVYAPVKATIGTEIGTLTIAMERLETVN